jgi:hypothetical protein
MRDGRARLSSTRQYQAVGAAMDAAVSPLQFRREISAGQHPTNLPKGPVAAYSSSDNLGDIIE